MYNIYIYIRGPRPFKSVSERAGASLRMCSATSGCSLATLGSKAEKGNNLRRGPEEVYKLCRFTPFKTSDSNHLKLLLIISNRLK